MRRFVLSIAALTLISAGCASGNKSASNLGSASNTDTNQPTDKVVAAPKFSSAYTDLNTECKNAFKEAEINEGSDMPLKCKGPGGYHLFISYSAFGSQINAQMEADDVDSIPLAMQGLSYDKEKGRKVEWRTADDKPFAVILRISKYKEDAADGGDSPYQEKYKTGESLVVKGLRGYEHIDSTVDAKDPEANAKAREIADKGYAKK